MADAASNLQITVEAKDHTTQVLKGIESSIIRFVGAVSATLTTIGVAVFPIKQAAEFQKELLNVGKTTEFSNEQLGKLAEGLKLMSYRLNVSAIDLAKVAAAGGQLGLGKEGVEGLLIYTEATSRFSSVLDVSVEQAGAAIGKLSNLFSISIKDAERISSTINEISNNSTASGAELLDIIQRIGTAGGTLTLQQSAALAAYGKDLGLTSETVGTTLNKIFLDLQTKAAQVAPIVGLPVREFADLVKSDGIAAFKLYTDALQKMDNITRNTLSEQITGGGRIAAFVTAAISDASTGFKLLDKELAATNKGWTTGNSAIKEQERVLSGLLAQVEILKNVFLGIAESVGRKALPYLTDLAKKAQEFGKDPAVRQWFEDIGAAIGRWVTAGVRFVEAISSMTVIVGPLLRVLQVWIGLKIAETLVGWGKSLYDTAKATGTAAKGWFDLITVNQQAIKTMAATAAQAKLTNAELAAQGKAPTTKVSNLGLAAGSVNALFKPYWDAQAKAQKAEDALNATIAKRDQVLGGILSRMDEIKRTSKATAQQAYDDAIASGSTKKAASAIKRDVTTALRKEYNDLDVRGANLFVRYEDAVNKLNGANVRAQASALAMGNTVGGVLARMAAGARAAGAAILAIGEGFLAVISRALGIVFLVQYVLDLLGLLDPVMKGLRSILGIRTEEEAAATRAAAVRDAALVEERNRARELSAEYDKVASSWGKAIPQTGIARPIDEMARRLEIVQGKMADISFSTGEFATGIAYTNSKIQTLTSQLSQAKTRYDDLVASRPLADTLSVTKATFLPILGKDLDAANREIEKARQEVDRLTTALGLAKQANKHYSDELAKIGGVSATVAKQEQDTLVALAEAYNAEGYSMLKALEMVVQKRNELKAAEAAEGEAKRAADSSGATDKELQAYTLASQKVRSLQTEVSTLEAAYQSMKGEASVAALAFVRSLGIDETTTSVEKLTRAISIFGGIGGSTTAGIEQRLAAITKEAQASEAALAKLEAARASKIATLKSSVPDPNAENIKTAERVITEETQAQAAAIRAKLQAQLASKANLERELSSARLLSEAYNRGGTAVARARAQSAALFSSFLNDTATVAFVNKQIEAQRKIKEGAEFHANLIKDAYEAALKDVNKAVQSVASDMQSLVSYFAGRKLTLKLAAFDSSTEQANKFFNDIQNDQLEAEKKRLQTLGLSSEELKIQTRALEQMYEWSNKMRQSVQDEQRQTIVLNDMRSQINSTMAESTRAQAEATRLAKEAKAAAASGDKDRSVTLGEQAAVEAEKAKLATEELTNKVKEFKAEAAKPISTTNGAKFLVSDQEITEMTKKAAEARVQSAKAVSSALEQAYQSAGDGLQKQNAALAEMTTRVNEAQQRIASVVQMVPELARMQGLVGEAVLKQTQGIDAVAGSLQSIANTDFRGLTEFKAVADQAASFKSIEASIQNIAGQSSTQLADLTTKAKEVPGAIREMFQITNEQIAKATSEMAAQAVRTGVITAGPAPARVEFPDAKQSLQAAIDAGGPLTAKVNASVQSSGGPKGYATGGFIQGPGTSTSDSILSWLSHGEYVMDARTTSAFGPSFFAMLQRVARGGKDAMTSLVTSFGGGVRLPAFANGGYVGLMANFDMPSNMGGGKELDSVKVDLGVGAERYSLVTERDTAKQLVKALHNIGRSVK